MYTYQAMYLNDDLTELNALLLTGNTIIDNTYQVGNRTMLILRTRVERARDVNPVAPTISGLSSGVTFGSMSTGSSYTYTMETDSEESEPTPVQANPFTYSAR